jgi:hypothetical protein
MDGRVLREALRASTEEKLEAKETLLEGRAGNWRQHLRLTTVEGVTYFLEGNGGPVKEKQGEANKPPLNSTRD